MNSSPQYRDAFAGSPVYRIITLADGRDERCAASDVTDEQRVSDERQLRIRTFVFPQSPDLVSVTQYKFVKANPPMSCPSLARVDYLHETAGHLSDIEHVFLDTSHHFRVEDLRMLDLHGDGKPQLVV
ncbi:MAG: hypothetical protein JO061_19755 [Acidobacteriaceae bacterium]|nr:hypothetical protein [Acidobacteriaceae bacterium]